MAERAATPTTERALAFYTSRAEAAQGTKRDLLDDREAILSTLALGAAEERWSEVLRLARAAEPAFMLSARWGAWNEILDYELRAARALGDANAEAWALHQRGSRALALGNAALASEALSSALQ